MSINLRNGTIPTASSVGSRARKASFRWGAGIGTMNRMPKVGRAVLCPPRARLDIPSFAARGGPARRGLRALPLRHGEETGARQPRLSVQQLRDRLAQFCDAKWLGQDQVDRVIGID